MEGTAYFGPRARAGWSTNALKNLSAISPPVQQHLKKVYMTLAGALMVSALGVYAHILYNLGGLFSMMGFIGTVVWLTATPATPSEEGKRLKLLAAAAFFQGLSVGTLVELVLDVDAGIVATAFMGTVGIFGCFSGAAMLARRREYLFLGGVISSALSTLAMMRFASFFVGGRETMFQLELYLGLLVFVGYVLFDTQMIIERASRGDKDYVRHSLDLFIDFVAIFVRLLIILMKNAGEKQEREDRRRKKSTR